MSGRLSEILKANAEYSGRYETKGKSEALPARRLAILTCMDARLDPAKFAGLAEGDAHVIRNAGGRASDDAIRSLVISYKLLGTQEFFVIHHTGCGMESLTNETMCGLLESSLEPVEMTKEGVRDTGKGPGSNEGEYINWLGIRDRKQALIDDVTRIHTHPLIPKTIPVHGLLFDVASGKLMVVAEAKAAGGGG
ncbi:MAG TPA: carbonic anhydrase [Verrucomicrobiae bacterium]|nr:carbonic anhydrase [Verrucomicrobiae bacterium]